ncbi:MAG: rhomboid family intramembrane serine protease [Ectothiorhodospiraceae bacterium]|jgi:membrane associated rhomboid family serine protease
MYSRNAATTPAVTSLLVVNVLIFLWQMSGAGNPIVNFALWPLGTPETATGTFGITQVPQFHFWQLVTYGFLHGSFLHILANMFALWMFGVQIERLWGTRPFVQYYFFCLVGAGLIQLLVASSAVSQGSIYPTIGASGAIFGILLAFGMMFPNQMVILLFPPIPMKAKWFVILYGLFELWAGFSGSMSGVAHFAHLGGMFFGFLMIQYWRGKLPLKPRRRLQL